MKENNHIAALMELSTIKRLKSFQLGGGAVEGGGESESSQCFRVSYYQFILGIRLSATCLLMHTFIKKICIYHIDFAQLSRLSRVIYPSLYVWSGFLLEG